MTERHAAIVGGGIGGLCAAIGLRKAGWRVTVLEQAPAFGEVGAGITLWQNALNGLDALGLADRVRPLMTPQAAGRVRDPRGRWLLRLDADRVAQALGGPLLAIHRAQLLDLLLAALPQDALLPGVTVTEVTPDGVVRWDGGSLAADVVVGADGVNSTIRRALWPDHPEPEYVGVTAFRAVIDGDGEAELGGFIGPGLEIGLVPLTGNRLYWFIALKSPASIRHDDPHAYLARRFADWPEPVPSVIARTPPERVLHHDLVALRAPLPSYVTGRVALLGDAAHAMTPFLGQGGCQAIEDAVVLAASLAGDPDIDVALRTYDRERRPRSQSIARQSAMAGRTGSQLTNPVAVAVRNTAMRLLPSGLLVRGLVRPTRWTAPAITP